MNMKGNKWVNKSPGKINHSRSISRTAIETDRAVETSKMMLTPTANSFVLQQGHDQVEKEID